MFTVVVAVVFPLPVAVITRGYAPAVVPGSVVASEAVPLPQLSMKAPINNNRIDRET
jgi:hypothetical protein